MLSLPILLAALCAAPATSQDARALFADGRYDELYLRFSSVKPSDLPPSERSAAAKVLLEAAQKLTEDPALAVSLAEKSAALEPSTAALLAAGNANLGLAQPSAAALDFEEAIKLSPDFAPALVARGELALKEEDGLLAEQLFSRVKPLAPERARAQQGLKRAKALRAEKAKGLAELQKLEVEAALGAKAADSKASEMDAMEICRLTVRAICNVMHRCMPQLGDATLCASMLDMACAQGLAAQAAAAGPLPTRAQLQRCIEEIAKASCAQLPQLPAMMTSIPACSGLQSPAQPDADDDKGP